MIDYWIIRIYLTKDGSNREKDWYKSLKFRNNVLQKVNNLKPKPYKCDFPGAFYFWRYKVIITFLVDTQLPLNADIFSVQMNEVLDEILTDDGLVVMKYTKGSVDKDSIWEMMEEDEKNEKISDRPQFILKRIKKISQYQIIKA